MESAQRENQSQRIINGTTQTEKLKNILNETVIDAETGEVMEEKPVHNTGRDDIPASREQIDAISRMMDEKGFSEERRGKALDYYKVESYRDLTDAQAKLFLLQLGKV